MTTNDLEILKKVILFHGIEASDLEHLIKCLLAYSKSYEANEIIFSTGAEVNHIGIILEGQVELVKENLAGNRNIVAMLDATCMFGEGIVCTSKRISPITVRTKEKTIVLFIPYERVVVSCQSACSFHTQLVRNMLRVLGEKNYALNHKIDFLILKGMREKIATYLLNKYQIKESMAFNIEMNRNELADYLNVSRSSMCRELSRMQEEGIIEYYRNGFKIMNLEGLRKFIS